MKRLIAFFLAFTFSLLARDVDYSYIPKKVYEKQVFPVSFLTTDKSGLRFKFNGNKQPILEKPVIIQSGSKTFYTFYFKTTEKLFKLPSVVVQLEDREKTLSGIEIPVEKIPKRENFSGVIASGLKVKNHQVSVYDEKTNLVAIAFEAHDANLEDIYIPYALKDGIENEKRDGSKMEIHYYIVLPAEQTELNFSYFDTIKENFVEKSIPLKLHDGTVAAQTDLNPKDDNFEAIKKYTLLTLTVFFVLLFLWKKDFFYLIMAVVAASILLMLFTSLSSVCIKEGTPLYIIPTENSTTSIHIDETYTTVKLAERNEYVKIEYKNGTVGWIKNEDLCKN